MANSCDKIKQNLRRISDNVSEACARTGRSRQEVSIVAVTKSVGLEAIKNLIKLGLLDIGENRAAQLIRRADEINRYLERKNSSAAENAAVRWHMVGHLQRNKVKNLIPVVSMIHSVDSLRLAEEINSRAARAGRVMDVFLEINCSQEPQKHGCAVGAAVHLGEMTASMKNLRLVGLMTMAPMVRNAEKARPAFVRLRELFEEMRHDKIGGESFRHMSMGMSQDYTVAVEEGATVLRIGTAIFR